jgi:hypothetical protein
MGVASLALASGSATGTKTWTPTTSRINLGVSFLLQQSQSWGFDHEFEKIKLHPGSGKSKGMRAGAIKHRSEFAVFPYWRNDGWEQTYTQPPHFPPANVAAGAVMPKDDGTQQIIIPFIPTSWPTDIRSQEPHPRPERAGAIMPKDDGTEFPFVSFISTSWPTDIRSQEPRRYWERGFIGTRHRSEFAYQFQRAFWGFEPIFTQPPHRSFRSPEIGSSAADFPITLPPVSAWGFDIQQFIAKPNLTRAWVFTDNRDDGWSFPFQPFFPNGWPQVFSQDRHPIWKSPDVGDSGIQSPFIQFFPDGWEQTAALTRKAWFKDPEFGDQGTQFPVVRFFPDGWEQVQALTRWQRFKNPEFGDQGTQFPFIQFTALEWPYVPMYQHPRPERFGAVAPRDDGIVLPMPPAISPLFETSPPLLFHRLFHSPEYGDQGTQFPFQFFYPPGWAQTLSQDKHPIWKSPDVGDSGIQFPFNLFVPTSWPEPPMHQRLPRNRAAAWMFGDTGIELFMPPVFVPWWESTPPMLFHRLFKSPEYGDQGTQFPFQFFYPAGWAEILSQEPHRFFRSPEFGDQGTEFPLIQFFPYGWPQVGPQDRHPRPERFGAVVPKEDGTELPLPPVFIPWFQQVFSQDKHPIWKSPTLGDPLGVDFTLLSFFPAGWEQISAQPVHKFYHSPDTGDQGVENTFTVPLGFPLGWEQVFTQPVHRFWKQPEFGDQGIQSPYVFWRNVGWEQVYAQPVHRVWKSPTVGDPLGVDFTFARFFPFGWEVQPWQPPHQFYRAPEYGDLGNQFPLPFWRNAGWEIQPPQPPHPRPERSAGFMPIEPGIEAPFVAPIVFPYGWDQITPFFQPRPKTMPALKGKSEFAFFQPWFNVGFEQVSSQDKHPVFRTPEIGDWGAYTQIFPILTSAINMGWPMVDALTRRTPNYRGGAIMPSITPDWPQLFPLANFANMGWPLTDALTRRTQQYHAGAIMAGDPGNQLPFIRFLPTAWLGDALTRRTPQYRAAATMIGDPGNQFPFIRFVATQWPLFDAITRRTLQYRAGAIMPFEPASEWPISILSAAAINMGWPMIDALTRRTYTYRAGAIMPSIVPDWPQILPLPTSAINMGWPLTDALTRRTQQYRAGGIMPLELGIEQIYFPPLSINAPNVAWMPVEALTRRTWAYHAGALMIGDAGIQFPNIPLFPFRTTTGKVFIIDASPSIVDRPMYFFGPKPLVNESCALVFVTGPGLPAFGSRMRFIFQRPDGSFHDGDPNWGFVGQPDVFEKYIPNFPQGQYLVYIFDKGELNQPGIWKVMSIGNRFFSNTYQFEVLATPPAHWPEF